MYHQSYSPFFETSDDGHWCLKVAFQRVEIEQHGMTFPVHEPWFTLEDTVSKTIVWSRQGNWRIDDAHELFVSDDGWSVIRFHGTSTYSRLLAISPEGKDVLTVGVSRSIRSYITEPPIKAGKWELWIDEHVAHTTAGDFWSENARFRFVSHSDEQFFVCRTHWGRDLILNLTRAALIKETEDPFRDFSVSSRDEDDTWAVGILEKVCQKRLDLEQAIKARKLDAECAIPEELADLWRSFYIALLIVRQDVLKCAADCLVALQSISLPEPSGMTNFAPQKDYRMYFKERIRERLHLAMMSIGIKPKGYAIIIFNLVGDWVWKEAPLLRLPECVENREALIRSLVPGMTPQDVAFQIGAPEYIRDSWHDKLTCPWGLDESGSIPPTPGDRINSYNEATG